jgi:uncharacterized protein (DUF362 family)
MSIVSLVKTKGNTEADIDLAVRKSLDLIGGISDIIKPGYKVLIKPNMCAPGTDRLSGANTRYEVCKAIADVVRELGANPVIAESSAAGVDTEKAYKHVGYDKLRDRGYEVIDLKKAERQDIKFEQGVIIDEMNTWKLVAEADVIVSVPVMKIHDQTDVTLGIKNLKGLITDKQKREFHTLGVFDGVVDIIQCIKPQLVVMDGTIGQQGLGPVFGEPVELGLIIASKDIVAGDAVGSAVMGYEDPLEVKVTRIAYERGLGEARLDKIEIKGEKLEDVKRRFKRASEVEIEGVPPFTLIDHPTACTGCRTTIISAIMDMKSDNIQHLLEGKTIVMGKLPEEELPKDVKKEDLILMGICTRHLAEHGTFVKGCPPNNIWVVNAVAGEGNEVKRRYATEEGATN